MIIFNGCSNSPNSRINVEYHNDSCIGIVMSPLNHDDIDRLGIGGIVFHVSYEDAKKLASEILKITSV